MSLWALLVFSAYGCCGAVCERPAGQGNAAEGPGRQPYGLSLYSGFEYALLADPMVGTGGHGHTYPGATLPFGMVQLSPDTRLTGWDGCSAYHYSDSYIYGFSHTHLSGTGCSDYGDILFMPVGTVRGGAEDRPPLSNGSDGNGGYRSSFSHEREKALPGFYSVLLDDDGIEVSLTATARCGFHRYVFPSGSGARVVVDLAHRDRVIDSGLYVTGESEISGFRRSDAWAKDQHVYFVARFSRPIDAHAISAGGVEISGLREGTGEDVRGWFSFDPSGGSARGVSGGEDRVLLVKVGISAVSIEGAARNLDAELPGWDFDRAVQAAAGAWDRALGRIRVEGGTPVRRRTFYTALYHSLLAPNIYSDVDGRYRGRDLEVHRSEGGDYYTVFSLWDTYRAAHPLLTIIERERTVDLIRTFLLQYRQGGLLPVWELGANETGCMIGYHAVPVIADAWIKGIRGFDGELALEAMKASATQDHLGLRSYRQSGFIPSEDAGQSVSRTLEYAYDDWCIAQMAGSLGKEADRAEYLRRSQSYKHLFDPSTGFMRARVNGGWVDPFDPVEVNYHYTEANSWQYSFYVPQDVSGLARLHGGLAALEAKLDSLFDHSGSLSG
ncbi:MAG TPA: GH92 family glycosyl hydrolase, partial [Candidatus Krumholzibacterium sp.]|nr:GH92 family glycosyl hydrolase [Candidatus Krumholzibacterium sp.]